MRTYKENITNITWIFCVEFDDTGSVTDDGNEGGNNKDFGSEDEVCILYINFEMGWTGGFIFLKTHPPPPFPPLLKIIFPPEVIYI